jgi:hypothetical protein
METAIAMAKSGDPLALYYIGQPRLLSRIVEASKDHHALEARET